MSNMSMVFLLLVFGGIISVAVIIAMVAMVIYHKRKDKED